MAYREHGTTAADRKAPNWASTRVRRYLLDSGWWVKVLCQGTVLVYLTRTGWYLSLSLSLSLFPSFLHSHSLSPSFPINSSMNNLGCELIEIPFNDEGIKTYNEQNEPRRNIFNSHMPRSNDSLTSSKETAAVPNESLNRSTLYTRNALLIGKMGERIK